MKEDDIEDLFKKSFEDYEPEVKPSVWKNIQVWLKWGSLAFLFNTILNKIGISTVIAVVSSIAIIGTAIVMNRNNKSTDHANDSKTEIIKTSTSAEEPAIIEFQKTENANASIDNKAKSTNNNANSEAESANTIKKSTKEENEKISIENHVTVKEPIAAIIASQHEGTAPLIVNFSNAGSGEVKKWTFDDGKTPSTNPNPVHVFEAPGVYFVGLLSTNGYGKMAADSVKIEVKESPSASAKPKEFSPNGDGKMDVFVFKSKNIASMNAKIFDSNGVLVYKSDGTDAGWDGKDIQGKDSKEEIYFYSISAQGVNGKKYDQTGSIKLTR